MGKSGKKRKADNDLNIELQNRINGLNNDLNNEKSKNSHFQSKINDYEAEIKSTSEIVKVMSDGWHNDHLELIREKINLDKILNFLVAKNNIPNGKDEMIISMTELRSLFEGFEPKMRALVNERVKDSKIFIGGNIVSKREVIINQNSNNEYRQAVITP